MGLIDYFRALPERKNLREMNKVALIVWPIETDVEVSRAADEVAPHGHNTIGELDNG